jgi:hypothetical protein
MIMPTVATTMFIRKCLYALLLQQCLFAKIYQQCCVNKGYPPIIMDFNEAFMPIRAALRNL